MPKFLRKFLATEDFLKMVKNAFYFNLKMFVLTFVVMWKSHLIKKLRLILQFNVSQISKQIITTRMLSSLKK